MAPRLSVIVPYYGVEEYIADCLASLRAQTFTDFEVILVDDGSLDRSREIAEAHVAADDRFRIITQPNAGLAAARNTGTGQATGEYLMFVDSDDLVAPRAFQQFVTTLDRTGSDFAGARVWRLNSKGALYRSFAHEETFSERVDGTTIVHHPLLMRDRMVWNKVYRRSFWDDRGYRFPELRFEDFPITLRAHLEARAVDLLPDPVYVWRERATGTSISQQGHDIANVRDRVTTALMVIEVVDDLATQQVRELVHSHLADVDLREVLGSLLSVRDADQPEVEGLMRRLVLALDAGALTHSTPFMRSVYEAVRADDLALARALSRWRAGEGLPGMRRELPTVMGPRRLKVVSSTYRTAHRIPAPLGARALKTSLTSLDVAADAVHITLQAQLNRHVARVAKARLALGDLSVPLTGDATGSGMRLTGRIPLSALAEPTVVPVVDLAAGPLRWQGRIDLDASRVTLTEGSGWMLAATSAGGHLSLTLLRDAPVVEAVRVTDGELVLSIRGAALAGIERPYPEHPPTSDVTDGVARFRLDQLLDDPSDNPIQPIVSRRVLALDGPEPRPCYLLAENEHFDFADRPLSIACGADGIAFFVHRPARS